MDVAVWLPVPGAVPVTLGLHEAVIVAEPVPDPVLCAVPVAERVGVKVPEGVKVDVPVAPAVPLPVTVTVPLPVVVGVPVEEAVPLKEAPTDRVAEGVPALDPLAVAEAD